MKRVNTELEVRHFSVYQKGYNSKRAGKWAVKQMDKSPKPCRRLKRRHGGGWGGGGSEQLEGPYTKSLKY